METQYACDMMRVKHCFPNSE